jgi:hypothetical protein
MPPTEIEADAAATSLYICFRAEAAKSRQGTTMTDREKILATLREKPMKVFDVMKRVNITNQDSCQDLLLKMRDDGVVRFDIHKGVWMAV